MSSYSTILSHHSMVFDDLRNGYYEEAIEQAVCSKSIVLDLGAGLGIHGFMAAQHGARKVYLVEPSDILGVTQQLVDANKLSDRVECRRGLIEEIDLPQRVDVIISVFTGNFLLTEDLLPSLFYARDQYLKPGGKLIPDRAVMEAVPISAPEYYEKYIDCWSGKSEAIDLSSVRGFAANTMYYDEPDSRRAVFLGKPEKLLDLDLMTAQEAACKNKINTVATEDGNCHGWLGWFRARLGDKWLSTSPQEGQMHWRQVFLPLAEPVPIKKGENLSFELNRPELGEWTWTTRVGDNYQRQSTFLSQPFSPAELHKRSDGYKPRLTPQGRAAQEVLCWMDGSHSTAEIVDRLMAEYPQVFPAKLSARQFINSILQRYS